jgi:hypothetical protein
VTTQPQDMMAPRELIRLKPVGFWSYSRQDDELSFGKLSQLRKLLMAEVQQQFGRETVQIFQDAETISHGAEWEREIKASLDDSTFFIPIITPNFVQSEWCTREVSLFFEREQALFRTYPDLPRRGRIFPFLLIDIEDVDPHDSAVVAALQKRQMFDYRPHRFRSLQDEQVQQALSGFAAAIRELLQIKVRRPLTAAERERLQAEARQREEEEALAAAETARFEEERRRAEAARLEEERRRQAVAASDAAERRASALFAQREREVQAIRAGALGAQAMAPPAYAPPPPPPEPSGQAAAARRGSGSLILWLGLGGVGLVVLLAILVLPGLRGTGQVRPGEAADTLPPRSGVQSENKDVSSSPAVPAAPAAPPATGTRLIQPGQHRCRVTAEYAFRSCTVTAAGQGRYELVVPDGLLALRGQLEERGDTLRFTGSLADDVPFICSGDRAVPDYSSALARCRSQPVSIVLRRDGNGWTGNIRLLQVETRYVGERLPERRPVSHELVPYREALELTIRTS